MTGNLNLRTLRSAALAVSLWALCGAQASAQTCEGPFVATNDQHVSAGRATVASTEDCGSCFLGICGWPSGCTQTTTRYTATGSGDYLGTSGTDQSTLYEAPSPGNYRLEPCDACASEETMCSDGEDDDCDGQVDCDDSECSTDPACELGAYEESIIVPESAFRSRYPETNVNCCLGNGGAFISDAMALDTDLYAPVVLPTHAVPTLVEFSVWDADPEVNLLLCLDTLSFDAGYYNGGRCVETSGSDGLQVVELPLLLRDVRPTDPMSVRARSIDADGNSQPWPGNDLKIRAARIHYELP